MNIKIASLVSAFLFAMLAVTKSNPAFSAEVSIDRDRMIVVDGKRSFIIGLYENPQEESALQEVAAAGFNLVSAPADPKALDRLQAHRLHAWINTGGNVDLSEDKAKRQEALGEMIKSCGEHPALLLWEGPDEALWNAWYGAQTWRMGDEPKQQGELIEKLEDKNKAEKLRAMKAEAAAKFARADFAAGEKLADSIWRELGKEQPNPDLNISNAPERADKLRRGMLEGHRFLKKLDPHHPLWLNHAPRNSIEQLAAFNAAADITGCDIYPEPEFKGGHSDLADRSLGSVGIYTERMQRGAPGKPVFMVLQGFGWSDLRGKPKPGEKPEMPRPSFDESRFMAFDAVVHGARGILYWGTHAIEKDSALWHDLMKLTRELADLQPVLSAPDSPTQPAIKLAETWGSIDRGVVALAKSTEGATSLIIVNEWQEALEYSIGGLKFEDGTVFKDSASESNAEARGGTLTLKIRGHGVQVLRPESRSTSRPK